MDDIAQTNPVEETLQQPLGNPQQPQLPTKKKLNWKGFFIGIIIVIIVELFAVNALKSENKQTIPPPPTTSPTKLQTIQPTIQKENATQMVGLFSWNVPTNTLSADQEKNLKSAFAALDLSEVHLKHMTHLSVDAITISSESANFARARISLRDSENKIIPTDSTTDFLQRQNNQWEIIVESDLMSFCQKSLSFPDDILNKTDRISYYGCPE